MTGFGAVLLTLTLVNLPPDVIIVSPGGNDLFSRSGSISFLAAALDAEDGSVTKDLAWNSSIDGLIGAGGNFSATLTAGTHTIPASALDSGNVLGSASVIIQVFDTLRCATPDEWDNYTRANPSKLARGNKRAQGTSGLSSVLVCPWRYSLSMTKAAAAGVRSR